MNSLITTNTNILVLILDYSLHSLKLTIIRNQRFLRIKREEEGIKLIPNITATVKNSTPFLIPTNSREITYSNRQTLSAVDLRQISGALHQTVEPNEVRHVALPPPESPARAPDRLRADLIHECRQFLVKSLGIGHVLDVDQVEAGDVDLPEELLGAVPEEAVVVPDSCVGLVGTEAADLLGGVLDARGAVGGADIDPALGEAVDLVAASAGGGGGEPGLGGG